MKWIQKYALILAILMATISGTTFLTTGLLTQHMFASDLLFWRFLIATLVVFLIFRDYKNITRSEIKSSAILGLCITLGCNFLAYGLSLTNSSRGAIITAASILTVLLGEFILRKKWPSFLLSVLWLGVFVSLFLATNFHFGQFQKADPFLILGSISFGAYALYASRLPNECRVKVLAWGQCATTTLFSGLISFVLFQKIHLPPDLFSWSAILWLALGATVLRYTLQIFIQQWMSASELGLIFVLEPIVALLLGFFIEKTVLTPTQWIGIILLFIFSQISRKKLHLELIKS